LKHSSGSSVTTYLFGAHIVSWQAAALGEMLYLSPQSDLTGQKPIRGGIPLVFPQFGLGDLPAHGFARTAPWHITACHRDNSGSSVLTFTLKSTPEILKLWPHTFQASLSIELSDTLTTIFAVQNLGKESFIYQKRFPHLLRSARY
jgi:glucose-6-phosphate 1-epimerase